MSDQQVSQIEGNKLYFVQKMCFFATPWVNFAIENDGGFFQQLIAFRNILSENYRRVL